jgi:hypothetical protein
LEETEAKMKTIEAVEGWRQWRGRQSCRDTVEAVLAETDSQCECTNSSSHPITVPSTNFSGGVDSAWACRVGLGELTHGGGADDAINNQR